MGNLLLTESGKPGRRPASRQEPEFSVVPANFEMPVRHASAEVKEQ